MNYCTLIEFQHDSIELAGTAPGQIITRIIDSIDGLVKVTGYRACYEQVKVSRQRADFIAQALAIGGIPWESVQVYDGGIGRPVCCISVN